VSRGDRRHLAIALGIVAAGALLRGAFAILVPLFEVESYYWLWSRELAWGYYDHPPMLALVMSLSPLLDDSALGLRVGHLLLSTLGSLFFYGFCLRWLTPRAALASLFALQLMPFWLPFGVVATTDGPLLFFWSLALLGFQAAVARGGIGLWLAAGVATGLTCDPSTKDSSWRERRSTYWASPLFPSSSSLPWSPGPGFASRGRVSAKGGS
jgi:dolichol-phosphate mannosyltransferase